jgi:hypothetical protein
VLLLSEYHESVSSTIPARKIATPTAGTPHTDEKSGAIMAIAPSAPRRMPFRFALSGT